jgi:hypothetical protein
MLVESALPLVPSLFLLLLQAPRLRSNPKLIIDNVILTDFIICVDLINDRTKILCATKIIPFVHQTHDFR